MWTGARRGSDGRGGCGEFPCAGQPLTPTRVGGPRPSAAPLCSGRGGVVGAGAGLRGQSRVIPAPPIISDSLHGFQFSNLTFTFS